MSAVAFSRAGAALRGFDKGRGPALVFQHGLGGDENQVAETVPDTSRFRRLTLECRGQGGSEPGPTRPFSFAAFADDVLAFCNARDVSAFVAGGISMGAAIALNLAVRNPGRVRALILVRPAWLFDAAPANMGPYAEVAAALREAPPREARARFAASPTAALLAREAPDNLASLLRFFDRPDPAITADLLADIAADGPGVSAADVTSLRLPTLVIGQEADLAHPLATAEALAAAIPGARLEPVPPKSLDRAAHLTAVRATIAGFLETVATEPLS